MLKNYVYATISSKYTSAIGQVITDEAFIKNGEPVTLEQFKLNIVDLIKNKYIELCLFDVSYLKNEEDIIEAVKYLCSQTSNMRIIVLAPNMDDEETIAKLVSFGVYDILTVNIDDRVENKLEIEKKIIEAVEFSIKNPKNFGQMVKFLDAFTIEKSDAENDAEVKDTETTVKSKEKVVKKVKDKKQKNSITAKRSYILTKNKDFESVAKALYADKGFNVIASKEMADANIVDIKFLKVDCLFLDSPTSEEIDKVMNLVNVLEHRVQVYASYKEMDDYNKVATRQDVYTFVYDDNEDYLRKVYATLITNDSRKEIIVARANKVITVVGAKGGVGATTIASLIANNFVKENQLGLKVCLVDFKLSSGTLGIRHRIYEPTQNIYRWLDASIKNKKEMYNMEHLKNQVMNYLEYIKDDNVYVMPNTYADWFEFSDYQYSDQELNTALEYTIEALKAQFDIVILDTDIHTTAFDIAVLNSNNVFAVSELTMAGLYQLKSLLNKFDPKIYPGISEKLSIVINKSLKATDESQYDNSKLLKEIYPGETLLIDYNKEVNDRNNELLPVTCPKKIKEQMGALCNTIIPMLNKGN